MRIVNFGIFKLGFVRIAVFDQFDPASYPVCRNLTRKRLKFSCVKNAYESLGRMLNLTDNLTSQESQRLKGSHAY